jgi:hypothetical protein
MPGMACSCGRSPPTHRTSNQPVLALPWLRLPRPKTGSTGCAAGAGRRWGWGVCSAPMPDIYEVSIQHPAQKTVQCGGLVALGHATRPLGHSQAARPLAICYTPGCLCTLPGGVPLPRGAHTTSSGSVASVCSSGVSTHDVADEHAAQGWRLVCAESDFRRFSLLLLRFVSFATHL